MREYKVQKAINVGMSGVLRAMLGWITFGDIPISTRATKGGAAHFLICLVCLR